MYYISRNDILIREPGEALYAVRKEDGVTSIVADIEENMNVDWDEPGHDDTHGLRVELYGWYGGDWTLDPELIRSADDSAVGEARGMNAGGICFDYEEEDSWNEYANAYECLFDNVSDANEDGVVIEDVEDLFDLADGTWLIIFEDPNFIL